MFEEHHASSARRPSILPHRPALWRFPLSLASKLIMVIIFTRCAPTVDYVREFKPPH